jgi:uncharacterized protein (TIGR02145 family)
MKKLLFLIAVSCGLASNAQNYLISFAGSGAANTVSTVKVENLTRSTSLTFSGSNVLRLVIATDVIPVKDNQSSEITIYPNPMTDYSTFQVFPHEAGNAVITLLDMMGRPVAQTQSYLEAFGQNFRLSGIEDGFYLINVRGKNYQYSGKVLSNGKSNGTIKIERINNNTLAFDENTEKTDRKGAPAMTDMAYTIGDRLKFTGTSTIYSSIKTDIPASDKTITFNFYPCTDGDNNNYPVVEIGTQVWMAENLKTTKYKDGTPVPLVTDAAAWSVLNAPGYCWYNNDEATYKIIYGALYHWNTGNTGNLCPTGWHVPSTAEWTALTTYLGSEIGTAGKLKETGTTHWSSPNTGATNEYGFSALPGGHRGIDGTFSNIGTYGYWDSSTEYNSSNRYGRVMINSSSDVTVGPYGKRQGISVRCLKDN